ncbi:MAG: acyl-CoA desaturase [Cyclobacteriaceae bacterium]
MSTLKFQQDNVGLLNDLRKRVNEYFDSNGISQHANFQMVFKTLSLLTLYFVPYLLILTTDLSLLAMWALTIPMGLAVAGIGMCVMHDANHGSYSSKPFINNFIGYAINLIGGNKFNWKIQHNVKHHTFTNIYGHDEDLSNGDVIRLSPFSDIKWFHKYQHIYSWFLYMLGTLSWVTIKDFKQFGHLYNEQKHIHRASFGKELAILTISKIIYYIYLVVVPVMILDIAAWHIFVGFITIHFVAGFTLSVTFQLAHVVEETSHEDGDANPSLDSWAAHQIKTTSNFARKNWLANWFLGGLNFQIEHHLFPNVCHIHYKQISKIVKEVVEERGLVYNEHMTFFEAVRSHYTTLKYFGKYKPQRVAA